MGVTKAPYGSWQSPITGDLITGNVIDLGYIEVDGDDIYWLETRPKEAGRMVIARRSPDGVINYLTPAPFNVRTRVHEYGGGAYTISNGVIYFSNFADNRIYRQKPDSDPAALTPESKRRYADMHVDASRELLYCVVEDHSPEGREAENYLAALDLNTGEVAFRLAEGNDFYASIALSPDQSQIAWLTWHHPNMPWDGCELWLADLDESGRAVSAIQVAGGPQESVVQPEWSPDGKLFFISDRSGWWNLYSWEASTSRHVVDIEAEFSRPQWLFRRNTYGFSSETTIYCIYTQDGLWNFGMLNVEYGRLERIDTTLTDFYFLNVVPQGVVLSGGGPQEFMGIHLYHPDTDHWEILQSASMLEIEPGYLSQPEPMEFPTSGGLTSFGLYYPPKNKDFEGLDGEKPPLVVISHGGPTSATLSYLSLGIQFWTSRGFAVLDVNYGGSTGYGREYRQRLNGQWGVVDLQDCENGAKYLVEQGIVDGEKLIIRGGSAGGYTTMCAVTFGDTFKAGGCYFGLGDLEIFTEDTHKFESRYLFSMVGPYPEYKDLYIERSPVHHAHKICCPVIFFQGLDDKIVPPNQSEMMFEAVRGKELPTAYLAYEGEGHGFRKAENIKKSIESELYFYSKVFGFEIVDEVEEIEIENL